MPEHVVNKLRDALNLQGKPLNSAEILLISVAYKRDVDDTRESPAIRLSNYSTAVWHTCAIMIRTCLACVRDT
jgi:UDP-N-acetyl-D-glucosamine dehydrogenase